MCTRVYTIVYTRVQLCIHACTLHRSRYVLCRALMYVFLGGANTWCTRDTVKIPFDMKRCPTKDTTRGACEKSSCIALEGLSL